MTTPPGVLRYAVRVGPLAAALGAPMMSVTAVAASRSMNVPAPRPTIITRKISALRRLYARSRDGEIIGAHDEAGGNGVIPWPVATRSTARRTIAVVCAV